MISEQRRIAVKVPQIVRSTAAPSVSLEHATAQSASDRLHRLNCASSKLCRIAK